MDKTNAILKVKQVEKIYGKFQAVKDVDLQIEEGKIYALLGHNGAGKSTLIKMILGLVKPSQGTIQIKGLTYEDKNREIKKKVGYLPERMNFYDNLTAWETIIFYAKLKGLTEERCEEVLEQVGLGEVKHRRVGAFSKGMQQRLGLAQAIIHKPELLVLDEPTTGLDPIGILELKKMIKNWNQEGTTILFSSHNLNDAEEIAQQIGIMHQGQLIAQGSLKGLQQQLNLPVKLEIWLVNPSDDLLQRLRKWELGNLELEENKIIIYCREDKKMQVFQGLFEEGLDILDFNLEQPDLNMIYQRIMEEINTNKLKEAYNQTSYCKETVVMEM